MLYFHSSERGSPQSRGNIFQLDICQRVGVLKLQRTKNNKTQKKKNPNCDMGHGTKQSFPKKKYKWLRSRKGKDECVTICRLREAEGMVGEGL